MKTTNNVNDQPMQTTRLQRITASQRNVCCVPSTVTKRFTAFFRQADGDHRHDDDGDGNDDDYDGNGDDDIL